MKSFKPILHSHNDLPTKRIKLLGLSFRDIAERCNNISKKYLSTFDGDHKKLRRDLSNFVNNPRFIVNYKGQYIGFNYGARITIMKTDGLVLHDVQTFCRDIKNINNRIVGTDNNFIYIKNDTSSQDQITLNQFVYSTLNINNVIVGNMIQYTNQNAYKVNTSLVPSSDPKSTVMKYLPNEISDGNVTRDDIDSVKIMDLHSSRKECIQAAVGTFGYASRVSKTNDSINYYVCKNVECSGTSLLVRLSYYLHPGLKKNIHYFLAEKDKFGLFLTAVKAADLDLDSPKMSTIFAPTNEAFNRGTGLSEAEIEQILVDPENKDRVRLLLTYHIALWPADLAELANDTFITTLADLSVYVKRSADGLFVQNAKVVDTIAANDSFIYEIDKVLNPASILDMITLIPGLSRFAALIEEVGSNFLFKLADDSQRFTAFAPIDDAFGENDIDENVINVETLINQHLIELATIPLSLEDLFHRATEENQDAEQLPLPLTSEAGQEIWLEPIIDTTGASNTVIINKRARLIVADIKCTNGILHIVNDFIAPAE